MIVADVSEEDQQRMGVSVSGKSDLDQQRLMTKVAWLYHNRHMRQRDIAERLGVSQSRVSRLLDQAVDAGVVKITVIAPEGLHAALEESLERRYGLREVHVFDIVGVAENELDVVEALGHLVAARLQSQPLESRVIGLTSWSRSLRATVAALEPMRANVDYVVEMLGDVGPVTLQHDAADATRQLALLTGAQPVFLRIPGVIPSAVVRESLLSYDPDARRALELHHQLDLALVGIGTCEIVPPLVAGENFFTAEQFRHAVDQGAVGEVNLRFIAKDGTPVPTELDELVVGVTLQQLEKAERVLAVAGGRNKYLAIRAALLGGWVNALVTDLATAEYLDSH